jgi:hypothetical protein
MLFPEGIRFAIWRSPCSDCSSTDAEEQFGAEHAEGRLWCNDFGPLAGSGGMTTK